MSSSIDEYESIYDAENEQSESLIQRAGENNDSIKNKKISEYLNAKESDSTGGLINVFYGRLPKKDLFRIFWLSSTLAVIIGGFWLLDSLKDAVLEKTIGLEMQPRAKILSVFANLLLVLLYSKLIDLVKKPTLFYVLGVIYSVLFFSLAKIISTAEKNVNLNKDKGPLFTVSGWVSFIVIESFGSSFVALFWAFVNSAGTLDEAKSSYGLIIAGAQVGAILGSTLATLAGPKVSISKLFYLGGTSPVLTAFFVFCYCILFEDHMPREEIVDPVIKPSQSKAEGKGALEGLKLIFRYRFVSMILGISSLYEIALTVLDYQMKVMGVEKYRASAMSEDMFSPESSSKVRESIPKNFAALMGHFGQVTNGLSLLLSLLGTSLIVRKLGLPFTLTIFPVLLVLAITVSYLNPSLWVLFMAVSSLKGLSYALNEPCKEMLYMVTSDSIKPKRGSMCSARGAPRGSVRS